MKFDLKEEAKWITDELLLNNEDVSIDDVSKACHEFFENPIGELAAIVKDELEERNIKIKY